MQRLVFMGTPEFALTMLTALWAQHGQKWEIVGVLTRADKPMGRGQQVAVSAVKAFALAHDLPVQQPRTLRQPEPLAALAALRPDVIVVAAYGLILPQTVLDLPPYGCLNVHASLLPRHRGAAWSCTSRARAVICSCAAARSAIRARRSVCTTCHHRRS